MWQEILNGNEEALGEAGSSCLMVGGTSELIQSNHYVIGRIL